MRTLVCGCVVAEPNVSVNGWVLCPKCAEPLAKPEEGPVPMLKVSRPLKVKDLKALIVSINEKYDDEDLWFVDFGGYSEPEIHVDSEYGLSIS